MKHMAFFNNLCQRFIIANQSRHQKMLHKFQLDALLIQLLNFSYVESLKYISLSYMITLKYVVPYSSTGRALD